MTQPPDDRADDGLTAELRAQLEEGTEEARRFAAVLEHQRAARQLVSDYQAGQAACPEGYAVMAAAVDWAHAGIGRARPTGRSARLPCGSCLVATWNSFDPDSR
jgi:hypothetical protein